MCTKFQLIRTDLITHAEPLEMDLVLTQVLATPRHWAEETFVPAPLVRWAVLSHQPGESRVATLYSPGNPGIPTYKYRLTAL